MPIEPKREGNACERCKKLDTEVGKITHYTKRGADLLLCPKCIEKREKPYTEICPKCKRVAYEHGGMTFYVDSDADDSTDVIVTDSDNYDDFDNNEEVAPWNNPSYESMCMECHAKKVVKVKKIRKIKLTIKNFAKDHWKFWISIFISIVAIVIGLSRL